MRYKVDKSGNNGWEYSKFSFMDRADLSQATACSTIQLYQDPGILGGWVKALVSLRIQLILIRINHLVIFLVKMMKSIGLILQDRVVVNLDV
jgi:hypothetical protein